MPAFLNLSGREFGKLTVMSVSRRGLGDTLWLCSCACGAAHVVSRGNLLNGSTTSCGCVRNTQGALTRKHKLWRRWSNMHSRCNDPADKNYGGRGISVCERWLSFPLFLEDMEGTFFAGATIERKNNNLGYFKENCIWADRKAQTRNRRTTSRHDTPWGNLTLGEVAERSGIPYQTVKAKARYGTLSSCWSGV